MKTYYQILGVREDATADEIRKAYKSLAQKLHPDKNPDENARLLFNQIQQAYRVLNNAESRAHYDQTGDDPDTGHIESQARTIVIAHLRDFIQQTIQAHVNGQQAPGLHKFVLSARQKRDQAIEQKRGIKKAIQKAHAMAGKITAKQGENYAIGIIEDMAKGLERDLENTTKNIEIHSKAIRTLEQYEMEEEPLLAAQGYISGYTTTSTGSAW